MNSIQAFLLLFLLSITTAFAQIPDTFQWLPDGSGYRDSDGDVIVEVKLPGQSTTTLVSQAQLTPKGTSTPLKIRSYTLSEKGDKILIYTNSNGCGATIRAAITGCWIARTIA